MSDPTLTYWTITELTPEKFAVTNEQTGEVGETDQKSEVRKAALDRAHDIRQFEIELYWKRATYFWILQAAVFTAIGLTWRFGGAQLPAMVPVALAALGTITSLAGWLSAKGSKFWQENWEHHIDMLEDEFEGRLHKTAYVGRGGVAWSVSGVNDHLAACFGAFWIGILAIASVTANAGLKRWFDTVVTGHCVSMIATIALWSGTALAAIVLFERKTNFSQAKGVSYDAEVPINPDTGLIDMAKLSSVDSLAKLRKPFLIRREPKT